MAPRRHRLIQRRKAVGLSQERLAELISVNVSTVGRWERADTEPQPWQRPRLARALRVTVEALTALLADTGEPPSLTDDRLEHARRRPASADLIAVTHLRATIRRLDQQYERTPSTLLLASAGEAYGHAVFLRQHATTGPVLRELWIAEMESATLMGQLVWDASQRRDHAAAVTYFDRAVLAARQARDPVGAANAELRKSYVALYGIDDPAGPLFCPSQHSRLAGSCWLFLGEPAKAERHLHETRRVLRERKKATAIVLGNLARASLRQGHLDAAADHLHEAIDVVEQTRGGGGLNVVFAAARELRPWRTEPLVQDVNDRLLSLMTTA